MPEVGTDTNPLEFPDLVTGSSNVHPDSPLYLWNDKGGTLMSQDAKNVGIQVVEMNVSEEILGTSDGSPDQSFIVALFPVIDGDDSNPITVEVDGTEWTRTSTFTGQSPTDEVYTFDADTGTVTFGNGSLGKIPDSGDEITISYTPSDLEHGSEFVTRSYLGVRSNGVIANTVTITNESEVSDDTTHVTVRRQNLTGVTSVVLASDPGGTNYFPGGSFNSGTGEITLGFALPDAESEVLVTYDYTIADDAEADFTFLGKGDQHQFDNPIPSNCAKALTFRVDLPRTASPSGGMKVKFRMRFVYEG